MKKVTLEFLSQYELERLITLIEGFNNQLIELEDAYCCESILYTDISIIDDVRFQLKEQLNEP